MSDESARDEASNRSTPVELGDERVFLVVPQDRDRDDSLDLKELTTVVWGRRWPLSLVIFFFVVASSTYAVLAEDWYRAEVLLSPVEREPSQALTGQLGGLAALAGVNLDSSSATESVATLRSRSFAQEFVEANDLTRLFFADDWDEAAGNWRYRDPREHPDIRDSIEYFHQQVLDVTEERDSGLVVLGIRWKDPATAAAWANDLANRLNERLRSRALLESGANVEFLREQLTQTNLITLQQSIGRLLQNELQQFMLASGSEEFAFRVIDPAQVPKEPYWPRKILIVALGATFGALLGVIITLAAYLWKK